jgi:hypothetical protein
MSILRLIFFIILLPQAVNAIDFELDRGIGFEKGRDIEDWVDVKQSRNIPSSLESGFNENSSFGQSPVNATSYGNFISIQTQPNSHLVLNASQANSGNQNAEINLKGVNSSRYKNVEIPTQSYDPDTRLNHVQ